MQRITHATAAATRPPLPDLTGLPRGYFTNGSPLGGIPATDVPDWFLNLTQEEIAAVIEAAGITLDATRSNQLLQALQAMFAPIGSGGGGSGGGIGQSVADTGASGHIVVAPGTALTPADGDLLLIKLNNAIIPGVDIAVSGHAAVPLLSAAGAAMQGGEGAASERILVVYSAALSSWCLLSTAAGAVPVGTPTASHHATPKSYVDALIAASVLRAPTISWGAVGPANTDYLFIGKARTNGTIDALVWNCGTSGASFTANVLKNNVSVASLGAVNVNNTTTQTTSANGGTPVPYIVGDEIRVRITSASTSPLPGLAFLQLNHTMTP